MFLRIAILTAIWLVAGAALAQDRPEMALTAMNHADFPCGAIESHHIEAAGTVDAAPLRAAARSFGYESYTPSLTLVNSQLIALAIWVLPMLLTVLHRLPG